MVRTQIQLEEEQFERLRRLASERSVSVAQLIREGVDGLLRVATRAEDWRRLWAVAGHFRDREGLQQVAEEHDEYLAGGYDRG